MVSRKSLSIVVFLVLLIAVPLTSALDFDNVKDSIDTKGGSFSIGEKEIEHNFIWDTYEPIEIKNRFGFGKTLFQGAITQHDDFCEMDCQSTMEIYLAEDSVLIDAVDFYTIESNGDRVKQDIESYQFYSNNIPYSLGDEVAAGTYEVKLEGKKSLFKTVDWVIETQGETLTEWATWNTFNNTLSAENITFTGDQNFTRWLNVSEGAIVTSAFMNLSGYTGKEYQEKADVYNYSSIVDNTAYFYLNYTKKGIGAIWKVRHGHYGNSSRCLPIYNITIPQDCWDYDTSTLVLRALSTSQNWTNSTSELYCKNSTNWKQIGNTYNFTATGYSGFPSENGFDNGNWNEGTGILIGNYGFLKCNSDFGGGYALIEQAIYWDLGNTTNPYIKINNTQIWNHTGEFNSTHSPNQTTNFATTINTYISTATAIDGYYQIPFIFHSDTAGILEYSDLTVNNNGFIENSQTYSLNLTEAESTYFEINITYDSSEWTDIGATLYLNGTSAYNGTETGSGNVLNFSKTLNVPLDMIGVITSYWTIGLTNATGIYNYNSTINTQSIGSIIFGICNATLTVPYINFTFEDEETTTAVNATIDTSTWTYYLGDGTVNKTLLYSTTDANESYGFCFSPSDKTVKASLEFQYSDTLYPQRRWTTSGSLTNTTTNQKLYMLYTDDGSYSVYQVQTTTGSGISGVRVQIERQFSGVWTLVEEGTTDSAGAFTAWLNPDYDHRLTFTKSGLSSVQVTVRPSSSTYTVIMGGGGDSISYNSTIEGLSWKISPGLGKTIPQNITQTFLFNITANLSNIVVCKMEIVNNNSVSLGTTTGCNSVGGNLSLSIPLGSNRSVRGIYSVDIGDGYFVLDADAYWMIMTPNIPERGTIMAFFKYARNLNEFGSDDNRQEYTRIVFFFLMLSIIMGSISYSTGWDFSTAGGGLVFINLIIIMASYGGFLTLSYTGVLGGSSVNVWMDKHVIALISSLFVVGYMLNKMARET